MNQAKDKPGLLKWLNGKDKKMICGLFKLWSGQQQVKNHLETLNWAIRERYRTLSTISTLAATLLIVATFNDKLFVLDVVVKILLSILLFLIPISLWAWFYEVSKTEGDSLNKICLLTEEHINKESAEELKNITKSSFHGAIPLIINCMFSIVVFLIIFLIWK